MRQFTAIKMYAFHTSNARAITDAIDSIGRSLRDAIASKDESSTQSFTRLYALLLGAWVECRLQKLIYEPNMFTDAQRDRIRSASSQLERWKITIECAFVNKYGPLTAPFRKEALPMTARMRFEKLIAIIDKDLKPLIELRNSLAHGQWIYPFTNDELSISAAQAQALRTENALTLATKRNLVAASIELINDLAVSKPTFDRDFDSHFRVIESASTRLHTQTYERYKKALYESRERGKTKRQAPIVITSN